MKTFRDLKVGEKAHVKSQQTAVSRQQSALSSQQSALSPWRVGMKTFRDLKVGEKAHVERQQSAVSSQHLALSPWRVGMKNFRDLKVWEKAHQVALIVYRCTASFPPEERFGLTAQMRRCAVSIGSNIAEGCGRRGNAELHKFLQFAMGSANELEYQWLLSRDLGYVAAKDYSAVQTLLEELKRMLSALIRKVDSERA